MTSIPQVFAVSALLLLFHFSSIQASVNLSVKQYNAVGDGKADDTKAIQDSIDFSAQGGGGFVVLPAGTYLSGTLYLKSGVFLVLQGSKLVASTRREDYPADPSKSYLVLAENAHDVSIGGNGEIDGQGLQFIERVDPIQNVMKRWVPKLIGFHDCQNVLVSNTIFTKPASWGLHIARSSNVTIADSKIFANFNTPNTEGIVIEDTKGVIITRSNIDTAGNGIVLMANRAPTFNIIGTKTWIRSKSTAIKVGDVSNFDFRDILFVDMTIVDSHRGIGVQMRDGGNANNLTFTNIDITTKYYDVVWLGNGDPISVTTCQRNPNSKPAGTISTMIFYNVTIKAENGILISGSNKGDPTPLARDIKLVRHNINFRRTTNFPGGNLDYRPGCQGLVPHRNVGVVMEAVDGIMELEDVQIDWAKDSRLPGWKKPLEYDRAKFQDFRLIRFISNPSPLEKPEL